MNLIVNNLTLDSREVAEMIDKRHADLIRAIEQYVSVFSQNAKLRSDDFFIETSYKSGTGKNYKSYKLTRKGCEFVANKLTGEKGILFTATYINKFHEMENQLNHPQPVIKRLYWSNQPVMTIEMFSKCIGISSPSVNFALQNMNNNDILFGDDLKKFKKDNDLKSSCNMLRYITHRVAMQLAEKFNKSCDLFLKYYILMEDRFKLPIEQMKIALRQASLMCASYSQIRDKVVKEAIALQVTKILINIGLWDKELDTEIDKDLDNESLLGWNKRSVIQKNISGLSLI